MIKYLKNSKLLWYTLILLIVFSYNVLAQFPATLEEGETQTFNLGGNNYVVELMIVEDTNPPTVTFQINNQVTPQLIIGDSQTMSSGITINIIDIFLNEAGEAGSGDIATISLTNYCGDNLCNDNENCGSCAQDCGCQSGYFCQNNQCQQIICGDNICSNDETCEQDNCCNGHKNINFKKDRYNCEKCGNRCGYKEICVDEKCKKEKYCGDGICEINEKDNCNFDCFKEFKKVSKPKNTEKKSENINVNKQSENNKLIEKQDIQEIEKQENKIDNIKTKNISFIKRLFSWFGALFKE